MQEDEKLAFLKDYANPYALAALRALAQQPQRFADLKEAIANERTRSLWLKKLKSRKLVKKTAAEKNGEISIQYALTQKGKEAHALLEKLLKEIGQD